MTSDIQEAIAFVLLPIVGIAVAVSLAGLLGLLIIQWLIEAFE